MMSEASIDTSLSAAQAKEIDRICDRFEAAWKGGRAPPDIHEYLGQYAEPLRSALLKQLLLLDWEYRGRAGEPPNLERYREQFPRDAAIVERVSSEMADPANNILQPPAAEGPGSRIGPYKLLQQIGEGGMGVVYMAEQEHPVRRRVALKIIKPGMSSALVIARFEAERQALAMMDHLNIARVLDAGATASGLPYFVMDLVHGVPITRYCDDSKLTPRERLELFVVVCHAIQHAHQKGIIHRDIKPSNVLVTHYDGLAVPKVIDFGVAKATEQRLSERTVYTQFGAVVGTLQYMPPEQAEMSGLGVDTRADVYSLGVLLYELLTGTTPLQKRQMGELGYVELVRMIKEDEPPKPSARLSTTEQLATIAAQRRTAAEELPRLVRGELDWIVMKALDKDRARRYETANGLARDVQRYLADETVEACPPSKRYRLRKFARKNRKSLITAGAFVFLLAVAALAGTWQAIRATLAETKTRDAQNLVLKQFVLARESEAKARHAQETAQAERQQAVTNLYHARVEEAAALRRARDMGYRTAVFKRLRQAVGLDTPDKDKEQLRDEAVACMGDFVGLDPITWKDLGSDVRKIALTPDGDRMAIALQNGTVELRNVSTGAVIARLSEFASDLAMDSRDDCLVTAGSTGTIKRWPNYGRTGPSASQTLQMHADLAGMSRNGRFAVGYLRETDGALLSVWDIARREITARLKVPSGEPEGPVQVSDDGQWVAQASRGVTALYALVWNTPVPEPRKIIFAETHQDTAALAISPDGRFLACQHGDDGLIVLDVRESAPRPLIRNNEVWAACFSGDGRFLVILAADVKLWSVSQHQELAVLDHQAPGGQREEAYSATFSADGNTFATALGVSRSIRIWKRAGSGEKLVLAGHDGGVPCAAFSPDGKMLASGSKDRLVKLWDTTTGQLLRALPRYEFPIQSLAFSPDGRLLATGQYESTTQPVKVWDLATLQAVAPPDDELGGWAAGVAFSRDGKFLAACGQGLTIWRIVENEKGVARRLSFKRVIHLPGERSLYLCISPDSKLLAWSDHDFHVCLWDLVHAREIPYLSAPLRFGWFNLAFYPDSEHLTFVTAREMIESWEARDARRVSTLGRGIGGIAASPDGRWLAAATGLSAISLWNSRTGSRVLSLPPERSSTWSVALSPNGERLAHGLADGGLVIWNVPKIQIQLAELGLAWRADALPPPKQEPQPFVPATPQERKHQLAQYSNLGKRLAWVGRLAEAEQVYRAALNISPDDPLAHSNLGKFLEDQARYQEAAVEFSEAIKRQPEHSSFWVQRGWAFADMDQWHKASADFAKAIECHEPDEDAWCARALLSLRKGDLGGYQKTCSNMLQRFGTAAAWTCTLTPNPGVDPTRIVSLAEKALARSPNDHWHVNRNYADMHRLGAALYRAARFEEAVKRLTEATELSPHPYQSNMICTWFFLAMAHHRLGHVDEARRWLEKGVHGMDDALKASADRAANFRDSNGVVPLNWSRKLSLQLLRREAEHLVRAPETTAAHAVPSTATGAHRSFSASKYVSTAMAAAPSCSSPFFTASMRSKAE